MPEFERAELLIFERAQNELTRACNCENDNCSGNMRCAHAWRGARGPGRRLGRGRGSGARRAVVPDVTGGVSAATARRGPNNHTASLDGMCRGETRVSKEWKQTKVEERDGKRGGRGKLSSHQDPSHDGDDGRQAKCRVLRRRRVGSLRESSHTCAARWPVNHGDRQGILGRRRWSGFWSQWSRTSCCTSGGFSCGASSSAGGWGRSTGRPGRRGRWGGRVRRGILVRASIRGTRGRWGTPG